MQCRVISDACSNLAMRTVVSSQRSVGEMSAVARHLPNLYLPPAAKLSKANIKGLQGIVEIDLSTGVFLILNEQETRWN